MTISVGDVFRDTYFDKRNPNMTKRTIRITLVHDSGVKAEVLTDVSGFRLEKPRKTSLSLKTLRSGYEPHQQ